MLLIIGCTQTILPDVSALLAHGWVPLACSKWEVAAVRTASIQIDMRFGDSLRVSSWRLPHPTGIGPLSIG